MLSSLCRSEIMSQCTLFVVHATVAECGRACGSSAAHAYSTTNNARK